MTHLTRLCLCDLLLMDLFVDAAEFFEVLIRDFVSCG
jgi:hypothetical protein